MRIGWFMEFLPLGAIRPLERAACAITYAECAGVSGPGYYAAGRRSDVQDVPVRGQSSYKAGHVAFYRQGESIKDYVQ